MPASTLSTEQPSGEQRDPAEPEQLLEVGRVVKPHGIQGEVVVDLITDRSERVAPGSVLVGRSGRFDTDIDLEVDRSRRHQGRWLVFFDGWATRDAAEMLRGTRLFAGVIDDPGTIWVHELIGSILVDQTGTERGQVIAVEANPASDLMVIDSGALVPVHFVTGTGKGRVEVEVPEGIFE